jgi:ribosomal protein S12 methylthiotransferase accessory factor
LPFRINAVVLTLDISIPVILIIISSESDNPPYTVLGLGSDINPTHAIRLALEEAYLGLLAMGRYAKSNPDFQPSPDYLNVTNLNLHGFSHAISPELRKSVDFLTKSSTTLSEKDLPDLFNESVVKNVRTMVDLIQMKGLDVLYVDLTTPDIDESGFKVVRVVVPGLIPLDINHQWRHLGGKRLYEVPCQMGLFTSPLGEEELNPYPHPFP